MMADSEKQVPARRSRGRKSPVRQAPPTDIDIQSPPVGDISRSLGRIEGGLQFLLKEMTEEKASAAASRAACASVVTAHAAFDAELEQNSRVTLLLRQGSYVIRSNMPDPNPPGNVVPLDTSSMAPEVDRLTAKKRRAG